jgi:hypothetical protein
MPNVTSLEPQVLVDLLALTVRDLDLNGPFSESPGVAVISPWFSNVELSLHPSGRHACLGVARNVRTMRIGDCLRHFLEKNCPVRIGVLKYGHSATGLNKDPQQFSHERVLLRSLIQNGAEIYLCPSLHAKGIVTKLGVITGTTNYTHSGLHLQMQNANYFAFDHIDYAKNRTQLLANLQPQFRVEIVE